MTFEKPKPIPHVPFYLVGSVPNSQDAAAACVGFSFCFFQESLNHYRMTVAQALIWPMNVSETPLRGMFRALVFDPAIMYGLTRLPAERKAR